MAYRITLKQGGKIVAAADSYLLDDALFVADTVCRLHGLPKIVEQPICDGIFAASESRVGKSLTVTLI